MKTSSKQIVVGYVRGSTDEQQNTLIAQQQQIEAYCEYKQFELARCFIDQGESAMSVDFYERPIASEMVAWMQERGATAIVITKLDRGFRGAVDLILTIEDLSKKGVAVHLLDIGLDPTTPVGEMVATIMAAVARFECRRRSERQIAAFTVMRQNGQRCGAVPYGWNAVESGRTSRTGRPADDLVPNDAEQAILRFIIDASTGGTSDNSLARHLNERGIKAKNGGRWYGATVASVRRHARLDEKAAA